MSAIRLAASAARLLIAVSAIWIAVASQPAHAQQGDRFKAMAEALAAEDSCWSCKVYEEVYKGLRKLVDGSYGYFVKDAGNTQNALTCEAETGLTDGVTGIGPQGLQDTGGGGAPAMSAPTAFAQPQNCKSSGGGGSSGGMFVLATTILAIAVIFKVAPIALGIADPRQVSGGLRMFLLRVAIVFTVFLSATAVDQLKEGGFISDFIVDGPLAAGTEIGIELANAANTAMGGQMGQINTNGGGGSPAGGSFGSQHVAGAKAMLLKMHQLGVAGIIVGLWVTLEGASNLLSSAFFTMFGLMIAGLGMAATFFMFTVTFGLRYIDALVRSMLIFALTPVFAFLWIFDSTRDIATRAFKSGLGLAAVFAVSGVVFSVAMFIMQLGFKKAFESSGEGISASGLSETLSKIAGGGYNFLQGTAGTVTVINWLGFFYLVGSAAMAMACAKMAFDVAGSLFSIGRTETGIGREVEAEVSGAANSVKGMLRR